jgi:hypothetical protein
MPELGSSVQVHSAFNSGDISVVGSLPPFTEIRSITIEQGRFYNNEDNAQARRVAFLGSDTKKQLFADREAMGQSIEMNGTPYVIIGIMKTKNQNSSYDGFDTRKIFIPFNSMRRDFPNKPPAVEHTVDRLLVSPLSLETHRQCVREVRRTLARLHNFDSRDLEAASIWDTVKQAEANRMIIVGMQLFMGAVGIATLFLGTNARDRRAQGARRDAGIDPAAILFGDFDCRGDQRYCGAEHFVRFLWPVQSFAEAAIFRGVDCQLETGVADDHPAWIDCGAVGVVSGESRGVGGPH